MLLWPYNVMRYMIIEVCMERFTRMNKTFTRKRIMGKSEITSAAQVWK